MKKKVVQASSCCAQCHVGISILFISDAFLVSTPATRTAARGMAEEAAFTFFVFGYHVYICGPPLSHAVFSKFELKIAQHVLPCSIP